MYPCYRALGHSISIWAIVVLSTCTMLLILQQHTTINLQKTLWGRQVQLPVSLIYRRGNWNSKVKWLDPEHSGSLSEVKLKIRSSLSLKTLFSEYIQLDKWAHFVIGTFCLPACFKVMTSVLSLTLKLCDKNIFTTWSFKQYIPAFD